MQLEGEVGFRKTFTDYFDDVSDQYPDLESLAAQNPLAAKLSDPGGIANAVDRRGSAARDDWYIFSHVTLSHLFMPVLFL